MLTSLNMVTDGLLDGGSKPTLSIVTNGLIRISIIPVGPSSAARQKYRIAYDDIELEITLKDDKDFLELLIMMTEAGLFD